MGNLGNHPRPHPSAEPTSNSNASRTARFRARVRRWLVGERPSLRPWHPDWLDYEPIRTLLNPRTMPSLDKVLYVDAGSGQLQNSFVAAIACSSKNLSAQLCEGRIYALAIVETHTDGLAGVRALIDQILPHVEGGGRIVTFAKGAGMFDAADDLGGVALANIERIVPRALYATKILFAGGTRKRELRETMAKLILSYRQKGKAVLRTVLPALVHVAIEILRNNLRSARELGDRADADCSSFVMTMRVCTFENKRN